MEQLAELIASKKFHNVVVMVGAGISVASGIPDFRSPDVGLYEMISGVASLRNHAPTFVFEIDVFRKDSRPFWWVFSRMWPATAAALPTPFHFLIKLLEENQMFLRCYTQNVDGLESLAGISDEKVIHAHGVMKQCHCLYCGECIPMSHCLPAVEENLSDPNNTIETSHVPTCPKCGKALVKPDVVFFSEDLPDKFFDTYPEDLEIADLLIIAGTSLEVYPFASIPHKVKREVKRFVINMAPLKNTSRYHFTTERDWFIQGDCQEFALNLAAKLNWESRMKELINQRKTVAEGWGKVKKENDAIEEKIKISFD